MALKKAVISGKLVKIKDNYNLAATAAKTDSKTGIYSRFVKTPPAAKIVSSDKKFLPMAGRITTHKNTRCKATRKKTATPIITTTTTLANTRTGMTGIGVVDPVSGLELTGHIFLEGGEHWECMLNELDSLQHIIRYQKSNMQVFLVNKNAHIYIIYIYIYIYIYI